MKVLHFHRLRATLMIILSVIVTLSMISISLPGSVVSAREDANYYTDPETKLTYHINASGDNTAVLVDIDSSLTEVNVPSTFTKDGTTYTVNEVRPNKWKSSGEKKYTNVTSITFPSTVKSISYINLPKVEGTLVIPSGVESIDRVTSNAASVKLPNTLTHIGKISFPNVTSIDIPSSVTQMDGNITLKSVTELYIPGSVKEFHGSIYDCSKLKTLTFGEGLETIGQLSSRFLAGSTEVETVNFPSTLKTITDSAGVGMFSGEKKLKTVNFPDGVTVADKENSSMFKGCESLEELTLPAGITPDGYVGSGMFYGCKNLKKITFGTDLKTIGMNAFRDCSSLEKAPDLSKVTEMKYNRSGSNAFNGCTSMTGEVDLSSLNEIPGYAFQGTKITGVKFSQDLTKIGDWAFIYTKLKSVDIPDSVTEIGPYAFFGATELESVKIGDGVETLDNGIFQYCGKLKEIEIGSGISKIADSVFSNCDAVEKATIHSSEDYVEVGDIGSLPHEKIEFTEQSVGNVGDTIGGDGPDKDWSLQKAVNEAENGGTVTIHKYVQLDKTLTIPEGKTVTIKSEDNKYAILVSKDAQLSGGKLIEVGEGRTLNLEDVTVRGFKAKVDSNNGLIDVQGTLNLGNNAVVRDTRLSNTDSSAIRVSGEGAVFNMDKGSTVTKNNRNSGNSQRVAPIRVTDKAVFNMTGGEITGNSSVDAMKADAVFCAGGVYLDNGASMNMTGGTISKNKAHTGSAVFIEGAEMVIDGENAVVEDNENAENKKCPDYCGGAIHDNGSLILKNGTLRNNNSYNVGGAIAVAEDGEFRMDGGLVEGNKTSGYGGGIYLYGKDLKLNAGTIKNNKAGVAGGGVYVEGNIGNGYATAYFKNTLVTGNSASIMGGGVWTCPTGRIDMQNNSAAVYDNSSSGEKTAGDDFALVQPKDKSLIVPTPEDNNLAERVLGGGSVSYYQDGRIRPNLNNTDTTRDWGVYVASERYNAENAEQLHVNKDNSRSFALKTATDNDDVKALAESKAELIITGNSAARGGGIGANGGLIFQGGGSKKINIEKVWSGSDPTVDSVTIGIYIGESKIDTVTLSAENEWKAELTGLPDDLSAEDITATEETTLDDFVASFDITDSEDGTAINVTATNTYVEPPLTPETEEPQDETPPGDSSDSDTTVTTTSSSPASDAAISTGDTFPTAAGVTALAAGIAAMIAAYMRRRRKAEVK
ncbi:MAG: leucine-rich repeat protein [Anaerovoracaceae bacterium]|jgi:hypothetical protein